jgi:hypothetical protein
MALPFPTPRKAVFAWRLFWTTPRCSSGPLVIAPAGGPCICSIHSNVDAWSGVLEVVGTVGIGGAVHAGRATISNGQVLAPGRFRAVEHQVLEQVREAAQPAAGPAATWYRR